MDSSTEERESSTAESFVNLSTVPGFKEFTKYELSADGNIYRYGKAKLWQGVNKYVQLCQDGIQVKIYKHIVDDFQGRQDSTELPDGFKRVSLIPGYDKFTYYYYNGNAHSSDLTIFRSGKQIQWINGSVILHQAGHRKNLAKVTLQDFIDSNNMIWKPLSQPIVKIDCYKDECKAMRKYCKYFRISNRGHIQKRVNSEWIDIKYGERGYICLPSDDVDEVQIDRDYLEDFLELFFDLSDINVDLSILD